MNQAQAERTVLAVMLVTGAVVLHDSFKKTGKATPPFRSVVAFALLLGALSIGAEVAPSITGPLALLIGLAIVTSRIGGSRAQGGR